MGFKENNGLGLHNLLLLIFAVFLGSCDSVILEDDPPDSPGTTPAGFPDFITPVSDYFFIGIAGTPDLDTSTYQLKITGTANGPVSYSLDALKKLEMAERTVTIECIGNTANGNLLGTATWKGFWLYDLLESAGLKDGTTTVKYICADGYHTYNSLEEVQNGEVMGALFMNGIPLPGKYGSPLRIIYPGYYGVRQPGWIVEMELLDSAVVDYWSRSGWHTDSAVTVDSKFIFPKNKSRWSLGDTVRIGGTAYGSKRISSVEITDDGGNTWYPASIVEQADQDYVWVFWEAFYTPLSAGTIRIQSRATGSDGRIQPKTDSKHLDGTNAWPTLVINVENRD